MMLHPMTNADSKTNAKQQRYTDDDRKRQVPFGKIGDFDFHHTLDSRNVKALLTTETDDKAIAAPAIIGLK